VMCESRLSSRYTYSNPSPDSGDPVGEIARRDNRSWSRFGRTPAARRALRYVALVPKIVTRSSATSFHMAPRSGYAGLPSKSNTEAPTAREERSQFHIIQLHVVM